MLSSGVGEAELADALRRLAPNYSFSDEAISRIHSEITRINGSWMANEESKEGAEVAKALQNIAKNLAEASEDLSGHEDGFRTTRQVFATSMVMQNLAPQSIGSQEPHEFLANFLRDARRISDAALAAHEALSSKSNQTGREPLLWHDHFTQLLLDIAKQAKIEPTLGRDPIDDVACGWLFDAATELEPFLYVDMRSGSPAGLASRLWRSLKRLR